MKFTFSPHKNNKKNNKQTNKQTNKKEKPLMDLCLHLSSESLVPYVRQKNMLLRLFVSFNSESQLYVEILQAFLRKYFG